MSSPLRFQKVCIVGVGLLGGSIGKALKSSGWKGEVVGVGRDRERLARAIELGSIDRFDSLEEGARESDLVIACTPVQQVASTLIRAAKVAPHSLLTDVGSTKKTIVDALVHAGLESHFLGSHPMAGGHQAGVEYAKADLFRDRLVIMTPTEATSPAVIDQLLAFWSSLGARTACTSPDEHDRVVAEISHLPHLVAAILAARTEPESLAFAANGWATATRLAKGDPSLWCQIIEENRIHVAKALRRFGADVQLMAEAIESSDFQALKSQLEDGKAVRDQVDEES